MVSRLRKGCACRVIDCFIFCGQKLSFLGENAFSPELKQVLLLCQRVKLTRWSAIYVSCGHAYGTYVGAPLDCSCTVVLHLSGIRPGRIQNREQGGLLKTSLCEIDDWRLNPSLL